MWTEAVRAARERVAMAPVEWARVEWARVEPVVLVAEVELPVAASPACNARRPSIAITRMTSAELRMAKVFVEPDLKLAPRSIRPHAHVTGRCTAMLATPMARALIFPIWVGVCLPKPGCSTADTCSAIRQPNIAARRTPTWAEHRIPTSARHCRPHVPAAHRPVPALAMAAAHPFPEAACLQALDSC